MQRITELQDYCKENFPDYYIVSVKYEDLIFEERVKMNCFYCGKYNVSWKCPPRIPESIDFQKMFREYEHLALVYSKYYFSTDNYNMVRNDSTTELHNTLLKLEGFLWEHDNSTAISFIGGSCKLCKNGCGKERCNNPYKARSPLEATGINVVKTAAKYGIEIAFPPKEFIIRMGMLLW